MKLLWLLLFIYGMGFSLHGFSIEKAVPFFRSPLSAFPSGETSLKNLENSFVHDDKQASFLVDKDNRVFWLDSDKLLKDTDFSNDNMAYNIISTSLRSKPGWKEDNLLFLPPLSRLQVLGFFENWAHVQFDKIEGYVDANNLVLKADFASFALDEKNIWRQVLYREGEFVQLDQKQSLSISKVQRWSTRPDLGIVVGSVEHMQLPLRSHVKIRRMENQSWKISFLAQHGEVYWLPPESSEEKKLEPASEKTLTTDELLKRQIHFVAIHPNNPKIGLVSANGIFYTMDGILWKKIEQFKNQDLPVTISEPGDLFVSNFRSFDHGKSFHPFLRWDHVTKIIQNEKKKVPPTLKITNIEPLKDSLIKIYIDTGVNAFSLTGNPHAGYKADWKVTH